MCIDLFDFLFGILRLKLEKILYFSLDYESKVVMKNLIFVSFNLVRFI